MQRNLSPTAKRYLSGVTGLVGLGMLGVSGWVFHHRSTAAPVSVATPALISPITAPPAQPVHLGPAEVGKASWYGEGFEGKITANGEHFDPNSLTCAHRTLPLGSLVRVTNLRNHRTVVVRVNDRGPMLEDRMLDLSYAAARRIGLLGLGKVSIQRIRTNSQRQEADMQAKTQNRPVNVSLLDPRPFPFLNQR